MTILELWTFQRLMSEAPGRWRSGGSEASVAGRHRSNRVSEAIWAVSVAGAFRLSKYPSAKTDLSAFERSFSSCHQYPVERKVSRHSHHSRVGGHKHCRLSFQRSNIVPPANRLIDDKGHSLPRVPHYIGVASIFALSSCQASEHCMEFCWVNHCSW